MRTNEISVAARKTNSARRREKYCRRLLPTLIASCFACGPVFANPTGAQVVAGQATIVSNGNTLTITNTPGSILNWLSFSIGAGQVTQFLQQNSSSAVLNRIIGQNPSQIFGTLESNGKVFLINPNGILFEPGSQVNVGGLVASSLNISNADFIAGKNNFNSSGSAPGSVVNQGSITTPSGGSIYLIAPQVQNSGVLTSPQGEILLAAGHSVQLVDGADPNIQVVISSGTDQALNLGQVIAAGGKIGIYGALVNQNGAVSADSAVVGENGVVVFKSSQNTTLGANSVSSAVGKGTGGTVEVLGPDVEIIDNALVNASGQSGGGKVMVGGDFHGGNAAIPDSTNVFISSAANIEADAIQSGNGGNVAVWSNNSTQFFGTISAQGGALNGSGGYVETSGEMSLAFNGLVNLNAPKGGRGTLLLDPAAGPYVITLDDGTGGNELTPVGTPPNYSLTSGVTSQVSNTVLETELNNNNATVLIQTGSTAGSIIVSAPITWSGNGALSLVASGGIGINNTISAPAGSLSLNARNGNITQSAAISVLNLTAVAETTTTSGYGNVTLTSNGNSVANLAGSAQGGSGFQFNNSSGFIVGSLTGYSGGVSSAINGISATAGNISLRANAGNIGVTAPISAAGTVFLYSAAGTVTETGLGAITGSALYVSAPTSYVTLNSNTNNISGTVAGQSASGFSFTNSGSFGVGGTVNSLSGISTIGGSINLTSTGGSIFSTGSGALSGPSVTLNAYSGIGAIGNPINTVTSALTITNGSELGGGGPVVIANTGSLNITGITQLNGSTSSPIVVTNTADITTAYGNQITTPNGNIGLFATTGNITLNGGVSTLSGSVGITASAGSISIAAPISASNTIALQASGNITQGAFCDTDSGCALTAANLSAVSTGGYVYLPNSNNNVGLISGAASTGNDGTVGFLFNNNSGFSVATVNTIGTGYSGTTSNVVGISSTGGSINISAPTSSNITIAAPINASSYSVNVTGGGILQGSGGSITTTGALYLNATSNIGATGLNNALVTNVNELDVQSATSVFITNTSSTLQLDGVLASSVVNISTTGALTLPAVNSGDCNSPCYPTNYTGSDITFVAGGNLSIGTNNTISNYPSTLGPIALYAGFTETTPGSAPVTNATAATMSLNGTMVGSTIDLWANSYSDFSNQAGTSFSTTPTYHPNGTPIDITVSGTTVATKTFDGTTYATLLDGTLVGVPASYLAYLSLTESGTFASKNVGNGPISVTAQDVLNFPAAFAGDFVLIQPTGLSGTITPVQLSVSGQSASNKVYNGNTNVTLTGGTLVGLTDGISGVTLNDGGSFSSKNVGVYSFLANDTLNVPNGYTASDFVLTQPTLTASITPAALTLSGVSANNKPYDGTTAATFAGGTLSGLVTGDSTLVSFATTGSFATSNVGNNIPVSANFSLTGAGAGNYTLTPTTATLSANIVFPTVASAGALLGQMPVVLEASDTYIVGLNTSTGSVSSSGSSGGKNSSGGGGSGNSSATSNSKTGDGDTTKLYCN